MIFAVNQLIGSSPLLKDWMNKIVSIGAIFSAHIVRTLAEMLSGPEALLMFNDLINFKMPSVEKDTSGIEEYAGSAH